MNRPPRSRTRLLITLVFGAVLIGGLIWLSPDLGWREKVAALIRHIDAMGWSGQVLLVVVVALVIPLMVPNTPFELGAGLIFPLWLAIPLLVLAETAGATIAFLLGRRGLGRRFEAYWRREGKLQALMQAFQEKAWKGVMITRMILMFPFKASNYAFGMSSVRTRDFILGTALGIIPRIAAVAYLGSLAGGLAGVDSPAGPPNATRRAILIAGIGLSIVGLTIMLIGSRRVLARAGAVNKQ